LPALAALESTTSQHPSNSKTILIKGNALDLANPFGGDSFNPFAKWTDPKVITDIPHP